MRIMVTRMISKIKMMMMMKMVMVMVEMIIELQMWQK